MIYYNLKLDNTYFIEKYHPIINDNICERCYDSFEDCLNDFGRPFSFKLEKNF